jgi:hypothetical protein
MSNFTDDIQKGWFLLMSDHPNQYYENVTDALNSGFNELNKLGVDASYIIKDTFFASRNIDLIQRWLIKDVQAKTKILIPYQKIEHIMPVMSSVYELYGQDLPFSLKEQIYELDNKVVIILVESIIAELASRIRYLQDSSNSGFIEQPIYAGSKGQRALPSTLSTN